MEFVLRLVISCICGGVIGFERSRRRKEAGIRTHILVALGASMMMIVSKYAFFDVLAYRDITVDASRIAANVITGISFLGAGVIFVRGVSVRGLTTAAGIWTTAGAGLAIGGGLYVVGIATTILVLAIQVIMHNVLKKWDGPVYETISVTFHGERADGLDLIKRELAIRKIVSFASAFFFVYTKKHIVSISAFFRFLDIIPLLFLRLKKTCFFVKKQKFFQIFLPLFPIVGFWKNISSLSFFIKKNHLCGITAKVVL